MKDSSRTLVVVPYMGEFGWELMNWQGRVRWLVMHSRYRRVIVCAPTGHRPLYAGLSPDRSVVFCPMPRPQWPGEASEDRRVDEKGQPLDPSLLNRLAVDCALQACKGYGIDIAGADFLTPDYRASLWPTDGGHQSFMELRRSASITTDILLIPRDRAIAHDRNLPPSWWDELAQHLRSLGLTVEFYVPRIDEALRLLSRARLAAGASTGGLHLASLCRCPHFVWGSGSNSRWTQWNMTNRQRYETLWNPLGTPCRYDECGWKPSIAIIADRILEALSDIGVASGANAPTWSLKPKWRIKRRLARLVNDRNGMVPLPWTVRNFVREHLV